MGDTYTHGHHDSVLRSHRWRTAENSCGYLLPHLATGLRVLDVGCGPGTITVDLGRRVAPGEVVGIDAAAEVLVEAERHRQEAGIANVRFAAGDVYALDHPDASFDVVHAHQVLQPLTDPVAALRELLRVLKPGGILAVRDSDYGAFTWSPGDPRLDRWLELYHQVTRRNGAEADAGRRLPEWALAAGLPASAITTTTSTWTFADPESRAWWGGLWADRVVSSAFATQAQDYGLAGPDELASLRAGFQDWARHDHGVFVVLHVEVLARRPGTISVNTSQVGEPGAD
jgi:SAM-dependent methyltransferase